MLTTVNAICFFNVLFAGRAARAGARVGRLLRFIRATQLFSRLWERRSKASAARSAAASSAVGSNGDQANGSSNSSSTGHAKADASGVSSPRVLNTTTTAVSAAGGVTPRAVGSGSSGSADDTPSSVGSAAAKQNNKHHHHLHAQQQQAAIETRVGAALTDLMTRRVIVGECRRCEPHD